MIRSVSFVRKITSGRILALFLSLSLLAGLAGCEALTRKFVRKPKEEKKEAPVLEPQAYPDASTTKDQLYSDYYVFWESWTDELDDFLIRDTNIKKQKQCAQEALNNLGNMKELLKEEKAKRLGILIDDFTKIKDRIFMGELTASDAAVLKSRIERIKLKVHRDFVYSKARKDFK